MNFHNVSLFLFLICVGLLGSCRPSLLEVFVAPTEDDSPRRGQLVKESFDANLTSGSISMTFGLLDGSQYTIFLDYDNNVQLTVITLLGEVDFGAPVVERLCVIQPVNHDEYFSGQSLYRLKQKNPDTIHVAEENLPRVDNILSVVVPLPTLANLDLAFKEKLGSFCQQSLAADRKHAGDTNEAMLSDGVLLTQTDFDILVQKFPSLAANRNPSSQDFEVLNAQFLNVLAHPRCDALPLYALETPCHCVLKYCVPWYPCGWKYCTKEPVFFAEAYKRSRYECGIRTCAKCYDQHFFVDRKVKCLWDMKPEAG